MSEDLVMPWAPVAWTAEDTMAYLTANPLPSDFVWPHRDGGLRPVVPSHSVLKGGYGKWLRETPYFQGLFELIHDLLLRADPLPDAEGLARALNEVRRLRGEQKELFPDLL
jgi:hypothetical protein